jgi:pSer/pThr/pTyr-binding forkhead associated (FHA) protein
MISNLRVSEADQNSVMNDNHSFRLEFVCVDAARVIDGFELSELPAVIGRSPKADVFIDNHWISRFHCSIERDRSGVFVRDLNSRNGTLVNEVPVSEAPLCSGDQLTLGMISFQVMLHSDSDDMPSTIVGAIPQH